MTFIRDHHLDDVRALFNVDDYYQVLRVAPNSDQHELKKAYLSRCLEYHPDRTTDLSVKEECKRKFQLLSEIYKVLSDKHTRQQYDSHQNHIHSHQTKPTASSFVYDEIPLSDCNEEEQYYTYACRCSGLFRVERSQLVKSGGALRAAVNNVFIVNCESCSESIKIVP